MYRTDKATLLESGFKHDIGTNGTVTRENW